LVNPPEAQRCDCGYDFVRRAAGRPLGGWDSLNGELAPSLGLLVIVAGITIWWAAIIESGNHVWTVAYFTFAAIPLGLAAVFVALLVSGCLFGPRPSTRRQTLATWLAVCAVASIVIEVVVLWVIPQGGE
jgi:hypothetical protein